MQIVRSQPQKSLRHSSRYEWYQGMEAAAEQLHGVPQPSALWCIDPFLEGLQSGNTHTKCGPLRSRRATGFAQPVEPQGAGEPPPPPAHSLVCKASPSWQKCKITSTHKVH